MSLTTLKPKTKCPPAPRPRSPRNDPPSEEGDGGDGDRHEPWYIFWFGILSDVIDISMIPDESIEGWIDEMDDKTKSMGLVHDHLFPWRLRIFRWDWDRRCYQDISRREFFEIQRYFERLNEKYDFKASGVFEHIRKLPGQPEEIHTEYYIRNSLKFGAMCGRPWHARIRREEDKDIP